MPASLHNEFIRAKVLGANLRFGRPNFFSLLKNKKINHDRQKAVGWSPSEVYRVLFAVVF